MCNRESFVRQFVLKFSGVRIVHKSSNDNSEGFFGIGAPGVEVEFLFGEVGFDFKVIVHGLGLDQDGTFFAVGFSFERFVELEREEVAADGVEVVTILQGKWRRKGWFFGRFAVVRIGEGGKDGFFRMGLNGRGRG